MTSPLAVQIRRSDGSAGQASLVASHKPPWRLDLTLPDGQVMASEQSDLFECLADLRRRLEVEGAVILCSGARRDVFPSGMARASGGRRAYRLHMGQQARRVDLIDIFEPAEAAEIASVDDQRAFFDDWLASLGSKAT